MLQIIGWIACVYLLAKGVEFYQRGVAAEGPGRTQAIMIGGFALVACGVAAIVFVLLINAQANATSTPSLPTMP
jgi:hypothetical protein